MNINLWKSGSCWYAESEMRESSLSAEKGCSHLLRTETPLLEGGERLTRLPGSELTAHNTPAHRHRGRNNCSDSLNPCRLPRLFRTLQRAAFVACWWVLSDAAASEPPMLPEVTLINSSTHQVDLDGTIPLACSVTSHRN